MRRLQQHVSRFCLVALAIAAGHQASAAAPDSVDLLRGFADPPVSSRLHAYWWWLNGNVTEAAITRDLAAMQAKGFGGALIIDAGGAEQDGNRQVPHGPDFGSPEWRKLYRHALVEARRLKLELALNIQSGWNLGGPSVTPADAAKLLCWSETVVSGAGEVVTNLPAPASRQGLLEDVAVVAVPDLPASQMKLIPNWNIKALQRPLPASSPDTSILLARTADQATAAFKPDQVIPLSSRMDKQGVLSWTVPTGRWRVYRFCYTVAPGARVSTSSQGWTGLALDPMDGAAFQRYWDAVVEPLVQDANQVGGQVLKYLHTDSWEIEPYNWTAKLPEEFRARCGYDLSAWLPVLAGRPVISVEASERFLHDYRKTVAALTAGNYFQRFLDNAHRHGLQVRAESGGPHAVPIDAQHCLGMIDVPMSEFWATSWRHRVKDEARFFVKQPASAAHTYGRPLVAAEGFTTIGPHWQERVWDNLKPSFDRALCEGLNQLVWTLVTCSPAETGMPGQEMFPGTHFNPNSTWWPQSEGFLSYINRCQWMLRQGLFVADMLYYYGDHAPNFAQLRKSNPAGLPPGYDYDIATEFVILNRLRVQQGRMTLPDGMSYAALVMPPHRSVSLPVLRKLAEFAKAGGTIVGPRPDSSSGLDPWRDGDAEARRLIAFVWEGKGELPFENVTQWLKAAKLPPDFAPEPTTRESLDYLHRRDGDTDIYFVRNCTNQALRATIALRVTGKAPEFWDPMDGTTRSLPQWRATGQGCTELPIHLEAFGSAFIVFRSSAKTDFAASRGLASGNFPTYTEITVLRGPWEVSFDPAWFYPDDGSGGKRSFPELVDWSQSPEPAVRHFSGTAVYKKQFNAPPDALAGDQALCLSLGEVREMARVRLNGRDLGIAWCPPWSVRIPASLLKPGANQLEIEVVNFWPNRLIGDTKLPADQRRTRTNITKFETPKGDAHYTTLMPSGLFGPVRLLREAR